MAHRDEEYAPRRANPTLFAFIKNAKSKPGKSKALGHKYSPVKKPQEDFPPLNPTATRAVAPVPAPAPVPKPAPVTSSDPARVPVVNNINDPVTSSDPVTTTALITKTAPAIDLAPTNYHAPINDSARVTDTAPAIHSLKKLQTAPLEEAAADEIKSHSPEKPQLKAAKCVTSPLLEEKSSKVATTSVTAGANAGPLFNAAHAHAYMPQVVGMQTLDQSEMDNWNSNPLRFTLNSQYNSCHRDFGYSPFGPAPAAPAAAPLVPQQMENVDKLEEVCQGLANLNNYGSNYSLF